MESNNYGSIQCQSCKIHYDAFDITYFRNFAICDMCYNDDGVIRTCMELYQAERNFMQAEQQGSSVASEKLINELKEFCFAGAREKRLYEKSLLQ